MHRRETMPVEHISTWAASHGMPAVTVDGNDVQAVNAAAAEAVATIRATGRPYFIETNTYRLRGHYEPDDQGYVDPQELAAWRARDPIGVLRERLVASKALGAGELAHLQQRVQATIDAALEFAKNSPFPSLDELETDVYA